MARVLLLGLFANGVAGGKGMPSQQRPEICRDWPGRMAAAKPSLAAILSAAGVDCRTGVYEVKGVNETTPEAQVALAISGDPGATAFIGQAATFWFEYVN